MKKMFTRLNLVIFILVFVFLIPLSAVAAKEANHETYNL